MDENVRGTYARPMSLLPPRLEAFFTRRGWALHPHQQAMLRAKDAPATLLIAPTGGGKTMAGFLPSLAELTADNSPRLHTLYVSPLKALATDIRRNLTAPVAEAGLDIRIEDRTGDTRQSRRQRQRVDPPHILLTTPESLALLLSYAEAPRIFAGLSRVIVDEIHALAENKRGDQLFLCLTRLAALAPNLRIAGLSATVEDPPALARLIGPEPLVIEAAPGPPPDIAMLDTQSRPPWAGGGGSYAMAEVLAEVRAHKTTLIFHNTRAQAEIFFHNLWLANTDNMPIGIHHGSLSREVREGVEAAMVAGRLKAIVCTGSLDLGLDWGAVDLVLQIGAPKNVKRLVQRIGRANHRWGAPSKARLVPANRFEVLECLAALQAAAEGDLDGAPRGPGPRDVLCQHILIRAACGPFDAAALFREVKTSGAYASLSRTGFDEALDFCATGGYGLGAYDRWQRLLQRPDGLWQLRDPRSARRIRMNIGTITGSDLMKVRLRGQGKPLGEIEEYFASTLRPGDNFLIGGQVVQFHAIKELAVEVTREGARRRPRIAVFSGSTFSTSTQLCARILRLLARPGREMPAAIRSWLAQQAEVSRLPEDGAMLIESFPFEGREFSCFYGFAGRNAQQTLGLILTQRMEGLGLGPLGFVATDYATLIWSLEPVTDPAPLLGEVPLRAALEDWLSDNAVMKRTFRGVATIAGLIERNQIGPRKSGRQATFSSDILYDTLTKYAPQHLMLAITREQALSGLVDFGRLEAMMTRHAGRWNLVRLDTISPFAAPLILEKGRVPIHGGGAEQLLVAAAEKLLAASG